MSTFSTRDEILKLSKAQHFQLACSKHFDVTHPDASNLINLHDVGNHPNAYFAASMAYYKEKQNREKGPEVKKDPSSQSSESSPREEEVEASGGAAPMACDSPGEEGH